MTTSDLTGIALALLENWRNFLLAIRDDVEEEGEGLANFIDIVEDGLSAIDFGSHGDIELASVLRLVVELNGLMVIGLEEPEHHIVLDAHSATMMRLANLMRTRGYRYTLPRVKPR
ncbi:hypothetical protein AB0A74_02800 [Saccharothrix sp. NPDC042600]|uniref:hypothetical protein n=1 Tax=Saccharothrix TaxID=2071 RepID=UPI00340D6D8B|nr:hypothetical protein GCM10017745_67070 [Saccharothrix mutabilis subsp. capreolus]